MLDLHITRFVPYTLWCDNQSTIALASNPIFHARTKHVEVDYHFIREKVLNKQVLIQHIGSLAQIADVFYKGSFSGSVSILEEQTHGRQDSHEFARGCEQNPLARTQMSLCVCFVLKCN